MQKLVYSLVLMSFILVGCGDDAVEAITDAIDLDAPVLASIGNKTVTSGEILEFTVTATDPNDLSPMLAKDGSVGSGLNPFTETARIANFSTDIGLFSWNTTDVALGDYFVEFSVTNAANFR